MHIEIYILYAIFYI